MLRNSSSHLYGCSVFTSLRSVNKKFFGINFHKERVLRGVNYWWPYLDLDEISKEFDEKLKKIESSLLDGDVYLRVTCWIEMERPNIMMLEGVFKMDFLTRPINGSFINKGEHGANVALSNIERRSSLPPYIKGGKLLPIHKILQERSNAGFDEVLFFRDDNSVSECSRANIFGYKKGVLFTPEIGPDVLAGVTRRLIINFFTTQLNCQVVVADISLEEMLECDALFMSNSVRGITMVNSVEENSFKPVQAIEQMIDLFVASLE